MIARRLRQPASPAALLLAPVLSCGGGPPAGPARPDPSLPVPNRVVVLPGTVEFGALGDRSALAARVLDQRGFAMAQRGVRVEAPPPPDTLRILGDTVRVAMRAADANGHAAPASALAWTTSDSSVAAVDGEGVVTATGNGSATISAAAAVGVVVDNREEEDRKALLALYRAVGPGRLYGRWDPARSISTWWGVETEDDGDAVRVVELSLPDAELDGTLPRELGRLRSLRVLHLQENGIRGSIPRELGTLPHLESLRLSHTSVGGRFPRGAGYWPKLKTLSLADARIDPRGLVLGPLPNIRSLDLSWTELEWFPREVFGFSEIEFLDLNGHRFIGAIPVELVDLAKLRVLRLAGSYNPGQGDGGVGLNGPIPPELGNLANLRVLNLHGDHASRFGQVHLGLEGPIPPELAGLASLRVLHLRGNRLTGPIPSELGRLAKLTELRLADNRVEGPLPETFGGLARHRGASSRHHAHERTAAAVRHAHDGAQDLGAGAEALRAERLRLRCLGGRNQVVHGEPLPPVTPAAAA
ncbi:hypothetical protein [Candidatus Palauibacter sp.]|uniref:hypothetical protein n=1 Tax=Candidatus Palauibacter sp. TaxID=3101350 RepID=UPI003B595BE8